MLYVLATEITFLRAEDRGSSVVCGRFLTALQSESSPLLRVRFVRFVCGGPRLWYQSKRVHERKNSCLGACVRCGFLITINIFDACMLLEVVWNFFFWFCVHCFWRGSFVRQLCVGCPWLTGWLLITMYRVRRYFHINLQLAVVLTTYTLVLSFNFYSTILTITRLCFVNACQILNVKLVGRVPTIAFKRTQHNPRLEPERCLNFCAVCLDGFASDVVNCLHWDICHDCLWCVRAQRNLSLNADLCLTIDVAVDCQPKWCANKRAQSLSFHAQTLAVVT